MKLREIATVLRSKNADPFITTCDVFIEDPDRYAAVRDGGALTIQRIAQAYSMPEEAILGVYFVDNIRAIKVSFLKYLDGDYVASGDIEDDDVAGMQRHVPLSELEVLPG